MSMSRKRHSSNAESSAAPVNSQGRTWPGAILIATCALTAYWTSLHGAFFLDDYGSIVNNPHIRRLWPLSEAMSLPLWSPPSYETVYGRPVLSLSLALNYFLLGQQPQQPWGYHIGNLLIHISSGLLLFGLVRRTLQLPRMREYFGNRAMWIALAAAVIWTIHPLNTECVTYIVQRAESLMGMFFLLTMYSFLRGTQSGNGTMWYALSIVACLLGMGTKEGMIAAPILAFLTDWLFIAGSGRAAWKARWKIHAALFSCWIYPILFFIYSKPFTPDPGDVFPSPWLYALTQFRSIFLYVRYSLYPVGLVFNYQMPTANGLVDVIGEAIVVISLLSVLAWALNRGHWVALLGAWFFLPLFPSSSFLPTADNASLHRVYLSLMPIVVLIVIAIDYVLLRIFTRSDRSRAIGGFIMAGTAIAILGYLTSERNRDYRSAATLWSVNIHLEPNRGLWYNNLGRTVLEKGRVDEAVNLFKTAIERDPELAAPYAYLGSVLRDKQHHHEAIESFQKARRRNPTNPDIHKLLGRLMNEIGQREEGILTLQKMVELEPNKPETCLQLAQAYAAIGQPTEAEAACRAALLRNRNHPQAHNQLGVILTQLGRSAEAEAEYREALRLEPDQPEALNNLGSALIRRGQYDEAVPLYEAALRHVPENADLHNNLGFAYFKLGRTSDAQSHFRAALRNNPEHRLALENLQAAFPRGSALP